METLSQLKKKIHELDAEKNKLFDSIHSDPEVAKAWKIYNDLLDKKRDEVNDRALKIREEMDATYQKMRDIQKTKDAEVPENAKAFLKKILSSRNPKELYIRWFSNSGRFVIVTWRGHNTWAGRGTMAYFPSYHFLFDISMIGDETDGHDIKNKCMVYECEGRLSAQMLKDWKKYAADKGK